MLRRPRTASTAPAQPVATSGAPTAPAGAPTAPPATAAPSAEPATPAVGPAPAAASTRLALDGLQLFPHLHEVVAEGREIAVTPTEFQLLETLMRSGRVVRSKEELARTLRGEE